VIDRVIELRPELVLIAGDVFHTVRPTNPAILHAFLEFTTLRVRPRPVASSVCSSR
jgi:DNA repair exonuclease SbcCD nuclease subunit